MGTVSLGKKEGGGGPGNEATRMLKTSRDRVGAV